jgi:hypothetical protein
MGAASGLSPTPTIPVGTIRSLAPTISALFGVDAPALSSEAPLDAVLQLRSGPSVTAAPRGSPITRALVYCPDAIGDHIWARFPEYASELSRRFTRVRLRSMIPPKTPVCYASVFTGATPQQHGVEQPVKPRPTLTCDTLFDAMLRAGKRVAIATVEESSIDRLFRGRHLTYRLEPYDGEATNRALELIDGNEHDLIVLYNQEYDDGVHRTQPFSPDCVAAFRNHMSTIERLEHAVARAWAHHDRALVIAPDHGAHVDAATGLGDHGLDIPDDMDVSHWYRVEAAMG